MKKHLKRKQPQWRQQLAIPLGEGTDLASLDKLLTNVKTLLANQEANAVPATVTTSRPIEVVPPSFLKGVLAIATSAWRAKAKMVDATTGEVHQDPSSTVSEYGGLIINNLQRRQDLLALHFRFFHSIHSFSRRVGGRATPAAKHALCASPITWLRNTKRLP